MSIESSTRGSGEAWSGRVKEGFAVCAARDACLAVPADHASSYQWTYTCQ